MTRTYPTAAELPDDAQALIRQHQSDRLRWSRAVRRAWVAMFGPDCVKCGRFMLFSGGNFRDHPSFATIDHIQPKSAWGSSTALINIRVICYGCNQAKARQDQLLANIARFAQAQARKSEGVAHATERDAP